MNDHKAAAERERAPDLSLLAKRLNCGPGTPYAKLLDVAEGAVNRAEAAEKDAERYRWMKAEVKRIPPGWNLIGWDAAIDAAMKETGK